MHSRCRVQPQENQWSETQSPPNLAGRTSRNPPSLENPSEAVLRELWPISVSSRVRQNLCPLLDRQPAISICGSTMSFAHAGVERHPVKQRVRMCLEPRDPCFDRYMQAPQRLTASTAAGQVNGFLGRSPATGSSGRQSGGGAKTLIAWGVRTRLSVCIPWDNTTAGVSHAERAGELRVKANRRSSSPAPAAKIKRSPEETPATAIRLDLDHSLCVGRGRPGC